MPVEDGTVAVARYTLLWPIVLGVGACAFAVLGFVASRRTRGRVQEPSDGIALPAHTTPLSTVMTLHRIQTEHGITLNEAGKQDLAHDIASIELKYFGPDSETNVNGELGDVLRRWAATVKG